LGSSLRSFFRALRLKAPEKPLTAKNAKEIRKRRKENLCSLS
jgi:hypothetical protein